MKLIDYTKTLSISIDLYFDVVRVTMDDPAQAETANKILERFVDDLEFDLSKDYSLDEIHEIVKDSDFIEPFAYHTFIVAFGFIEGLYEDTKVTVASSLDGWNHECAIELYV